MLFRKRVTAIAKIAGIFVMWLGLLSGCGNKDDKTGASGDAEANYTSLWTNVFADRCGTCHGVDTNSNTLKGPDMRTKEVFYSQLVGKKGSDYNGWDTFQTNRVDCLGSYFIESGAASKSLVVAVLDSSVAPCTVKSHLEPPQSISISATSLANLKTWIDKGAVQ